MHWLATMETAAAARGLETSMSSTYGLVSTGGFAGTSAAAPFVSGIAAVIKTGVTSSLG